MFKCKICNLEFPSKQKLGGHASSHNRGQEYKLKRETQKSSERKKKSLEKIKTCIYCKKDFERLRLTACVRTRVKPLNRVKHYFNPG